MSSTFRMPTFPAESDLVPAINLDGQVTRTSAHYIACGGFADIYLGEYVQGDKKQMVAIKVLRGVHTDPGVSETITRRINRESKVWSNLEHPNVLPILGICFDIMPSPTLISPYCKHGSVMVYLLKNPNVNRSGLLGGVASGLQYLHSQDVVHGDLKITNILIDDSGTPRLCDFGRSKILGHAGYTTGPPQVYRVTAPELLKAEGTSDTPRLTPQGDVYSFSMVTLEILTGKIPFCHLANDYSVVVELIQCKRPKRERYDPPGLGEWIWRLIEDCWNQDPKLRPNMEDVCKRLTNQA